jgi:hypothetical protein
MKSLSEIQLLATLDQMWCRSEDSHIFYKTFLVSPWCAFHLRAFETGSRTKVMARFFDTRFSSVHDETVQSSAERSRAALLAVSRLAELYAEAESRHAKRLGLMCPSTNPQGEYHHAA